MNKINRSTFTRRQATGTLASAIGLGVLPSMSRKLQAKDYSSTPRPPGVKYTCSSHADDPFKVALWEGFGHMVQQTSKLNVDIGTGRFAQLTRTINVQFSVPPNACTLSLIVVVTRILKCVLHEPAGPWEAQHRSTHERRFKCVAGLPLVHEENYQASDQPIAPDFIQRWEHFEREDGATFPHHSTLPWILKSLVGDKPSNGPAICPQIMPVIVNDTPSVPFAPIAPWGSIEFGIVCCNM